jgi:hypothetical protein
MAWWLEDTETSARAQSNPRRLMEGDRREVSLSLKYPVIMSQASLVKQISENVPSVPDFPGIEAQRPARSMVVVTG